MKKSYISKFIDTLITFLTAAFFTMAVAGYFMGDTAAIIAAAVAGGLAMTALLSLSQAKKQKKTDPQIRETMNQFIFGGEDFALGHFFNALCKRYKPVSHNGFLMVRATAVFVKIRLNKLSASDTAIFYGLARAQNAKRLLILTAAGADKDCAALIKTLPDIKITVLNEEKVFSLLKALGAIPPVLIKLNKPKKAPLKDFALGALEPDRSRGYFYISFILIVSSLFMRHGIYYLCVSALCLTLGVLCRLDIKQKLRKNG